LAHRQKCSRYIGMRVAGRIIEFALLGVGGRPAERSAHFQSRCRRDHALRDPIAAIDARETILTRIALTVSEPPARAETLGNRAAGAAADGQELAGSPPST